MSGFDAPSNASEQVVLILVDIKAPNKFIVLIHQVATAGYRFYLSLSLPLATQYYHNLWASKVSLLLLQSKMIK